MADSAVPAEDYRYALRQLLIGWRMHTANGVELPAERVPVLTLVYPWVAQVHRFGRAFLQLEKHGYAHESHALVRSALEHTLMSHWVSITGDSGVVSRYAEDDRLLGVMLHEARGRPQDVTASTWNLDLLQELIDSREPVGVNDEKVVQKVEQICDQIGVKNSLYPAYRMLSWFAHPTTHTTSMFLEALDDGTFALRDKPAGIAPESMVSMLTHCVYWSRRVLDDLLTGRRYETWLDGIASSIQVMPRLPERRAPASRL